MSDSPLSPEPHAASHAHADSRRLLPLTLTALGVVYGDIGTSPLYALRECFFGSHSVPPTHENVLGVLSLIIYSLVLVISIKYVVIVMRADNQGEGGVLALTALIPGRAGAAGGPARLAVGRPLLIALGIFGTALLYGDGMITPAISVLGAVEGLEVVTPLFRPYVVPVTVVILVGAVRHPEVRDAPRRRAVRPDHGRLVRRRIAALGVVWIVRAPAVLAAFDPRHAVDASSSPTASPASPCSARCSWWSPAARRSTPTWATSASSPIRLAWFAFVLPALVLNYLGQGALLLIDPDASSTPSSCSRRRGRCCRWSALATAAAIIASQALISGSFSITRQAIQLGLAPRLDVEHTSAREMGQIYVPQVNWALMFATLLIVIGFGSSSALAAAYGIAVTLTMVITVLLLYVVMTERWQWPKPAALAVMVVFLTIDLAFFGANALKLMQGGWVTLAVALLLFTLMTTWKTGRRLVAERLTARAIPLEEFIATRRGASGRCACPGPRCS